MFCFLSRVSYVRGVAGAQYRRQVQSSFEDVDGPVLVGELLSPDVDEIRKRLEEGFPELAQDKHNRDVLVQALHGLSTSESETV